VRVYVSWRRHCGAVRLYGGCVAQHAISVRCCILTVIQLAVSLFHCVREVPTRIPFHFPLLCFTTGLTAAPRCVHKVSNKQHLYHPYTTI
jgi:hypothetical protein